MAGITQNSQKSLIFIVIPKQRDQLKLLVLLIEGNGSNKYSDTSDNSSNTDNDKDYISDKDNNRNLRVT